MLFSINPYSHTTIALYEEDSFASIKDKVSAAYHFEFERQKVTPLFSKLALLLRNDIENLARIITDEMGKPIIQSRAEKNARCFANIMQLIPLNFWRMRS
jgi:succinate-semialdehyde dehydrogenase/glutarate-semialdehyde dehydrogenase